MERGYWTSLRICLKTIEAMEKHTLSYKHQVKSKFKTTAGARKQIYRAQGPVGFVEGLELRSDLRREEVARRPSLRRQPLSSLQGEGV